MLEGNYIVTVLYKGITVPVIPAAYIDSLVQINDARGPIFSHCAVKIELFLFRVFQQPVHR
jgi:hypothetical protein